MNTAHRIRTVAVAALAMTGLVLSAPALADVTASEAWARATPPGAKSGAIYLTLVNPANEERKLLKIVTPLSDEVMVHQTSVTELGVARMWPMAWLNVDAGQTVKMQPGGLHVMVNALKTPLVAGQKFPLTLKFDGGEAEFTVQVEVRPLTSDEHAHQH